jgi:hypothetical protein
VPGISTTIKEVMRKSAVSIWVDAQA